MIVLVWSCLICRHRDWWLLEQWHQALAQGPKLRRIGKDSVRGVPNRDVHCIVMLFFCFHYEYR